MKNKKYNLIYLNRKQLGLQRTRDFKNGDVLRVGKYMIWIKGEYPYLKTFAEHDDRPMRPLKESQMPQYIHDFIF